MVMKREIVINTYSFLCPFSWFCITLFIVKHFPLPILECRRSRNPPLFLLFPYNCYMPFLFFFFFFFSFFISSYFFGCLSTFQTVLGQPGEATVLQRLN